MNLRLFLCLFVCLSVCLSVCLIRWLASSFFHLETLGEETTLEDLQAIDTQTASLITTIRETPSPQAFLALLFIDCFKFSSALSVTSSQ